MTSQPDPRLAEALQQTQHVISALEDSTFRTANESFTATDEAGTVKVTVNGARWLTGLSIQRGLLRLGADTVKQRVNEALHKAHAAAIEAAEAEGPQLDDRIAAMFGGLQALLEDIPKTG